MPLKILLIRPSFEAQATGKLLAHKGYEPILSPLVQIVFLSNTIIEKAHGYIYYQSKCRWSL